jgi:membrane dipeptidase
MSLSLIEGGYSVGNQDNIPTLAAAGVAYITWAHLRFRGVSACVNGLPFMNDTAFAATHPMPVKGLTELGYKIADAMMDNGILIDITHMTNEAIADIITMAKTKKRPIFSSHTAPRKTSSEEYLLNLSDDRMRDIRDTGGVIGIIAFKHWLHDPSKRKEKQDLRLMMKAVGHVLSVVGEDHVAIGSDLDGFIEPVDGLDKLRNFTALRNAILEAYPGFAEKLLWRNAYEMLKAVGWTVKRAPAPAYSI